MTRALALLLGVLALAAPAAAQQVPSPMNNDAVNAKLPTARENLQLGTVQSEGGAPPAEANLITRFYTFDSFTGKSKLFEIPSRPGANEYAIEQAGLAGVTGGVGQGATRVCYAPYSNDEVDCNYIAYGSRGVHRFGNGAGMLAEMAYEMSGPPTTQAAPLGWLRFVATNNDIAKLEAYGASWNTDIGLDLMAKGAGPIRIGNGLGITSFGDPTPWSGTGPLLAGGKLFTVQRRVAIYNDRYIRLLGGSHYGDPSIQAFSDYDDVGPFGGTSRANVDLRLMGKGSAAVVFENDFGILGRFDSASDATSRVHMKFLGNNGTLGVVAVESAYTFAVPMYVLAQGAGSVILANQDDSDGGNNLAVFGSRGAGSYPFGFTQQSASGIPASIGSSGGSMSLYGYRFRSICPADPWPPVYPCYPDGSTQANFSVTIPDSGTHYTNAGATGLTNFYLYPTTSSSLGANFCFTRDVAQAVRITASPNDKIAIAPTNSALGGYIDTNGDFASICLETHREGQWIAYATPDKTQWTVH